MIFVSGAERPKPLVDLGPSSNLPEDYGVDFMWATPNGLVGFQRKAFPSDLLASLNDGRLGKELIQMQALDVKGIILEGVPIFTGDGALIWNYGNMTQANLWNLCYSLQANHGLVLFWTEDPAQTARLIQQIFAYTQKGEASKLMARGEKRWARLDNRAFAVYLLESVPGVGHTRATAIVDFFEGALPIEWKGTVKELMKVDGIGAKTAQTIVTAFGGKV